MPQEKSSEIHWVAASERRWAELVHKTQRDFATLLPPQRQEAVEHVTGRLAAMTAWADGARARGHFPAAHLFAREQALWQDLLDAVQ